jgi:hypothetical protein
MLSKISFSVFMVRFGPSAKILRFELETKTAISIILSFLKSRPENSKSIQIKLSSFFIA